MISHTPTLVSSGQAKTRVEKYDKVLALSGSMERDAAHTERSKAADDCTNCVLPPSNPRSNLSCTVMRPKPIVPLKAARLPIVLRKRTARLAVPSSRQKCPIPICKRLDCRLRTHRKYAKMSSVCTDDLQRAVEAWRSPSPLLRGDVSGLPELPLGHKQPAIYRAMFHQFFDSEYDRIVLLLQPPPLSKEERTKASQLKKDLLVQAFQKPVFCINYIATAYHSSVLTKRKASDDPYIAILRGKVLQLLREWLADFRHEDVDCLLLVVILTLVMLDLAAQNYCNLDIHRAGMERLVNSVGGVHNLVQA